jgi:hypothetical protein
MAASIASSFTGQAVKAASVKQQRRVAARSPGAFVVRAMLEQQRMATPFDGFK